eukprot:gnl/TRDRNA2_/TRDRNA2_196276_c0_seq1.p1 gnl/TRDRNA2_/TRDRNA2_196276_c0~~gnl/TRDRNA2_/TRDRNA2_196276_c0_seq1.p1  ORF type:complete len:261 (-),score=19.20 gnl/TRDRNA2_/TRDRNA2_196276_c0_seq1:69-851(-)
MGNPAEMPPAGMASGGKRSNGAAGFATGNLPPRDSSGVSACLGMGPSAQVQESPRIAQGYTSTGSHYQAATRNAPRTPLGSPRALPGAGGLGGSSGGMYGDSAYGLGKRGGRGAGHQQHTHESWIALRGSVPDPHGRMPQLGPSAAGYPTTPRQEAGTRDALYPTAGVYKDPENAPAGRAQPEGKGISRFSYGRGWASPRTWEILGHECPKGLDEEPRRKAAAGDVGWNSRDPEYGLGRRGCQNKPERSIVVTPTGWNLK